MRVGWWGLFAVLVLLAGCEHGKGEPAPVAADWSAWQGRWTGPEGTFLEIGKVGDRYPITIQNLDGPSTFEGVATAEGIQFVRHGETELLHASDGAGTGMKWLQDKKNCLTVRPGEGFCRD